MIYDICDIYMIYIYVYDRYGYTWINCNVLTSFSVTARNWLGLGESSELVLLQVDELV